MSINDQLNDKTSQRRSFSLLPSHMLLTKVIWMALIVCSSNAFGEDAIFSDSAKFKIPFQLDQNELKKIGATEIQLYASQNMGASWRLHESVAPDSTEFVYIAPADGEYWFSVRTKTASGLTYPAGPHQAGLKVVVDTVKPELTLDLNEIAPGKIELDWQTTDPHLALDSLKLEQVNPKTHDWQTLQFQSANTGRTAWEVSAAGLVEVRGSVKDLAGNVTEIATQTIIAGKMPTGPQGESRSRPIAAGTSSQAKMLSNQPIEVEVTPRRPRSILTSNQAQEIVLPQHLETITPKVNRPNDQLVLPQLEEAIQNGEIFDRKATSEVLPLKELTPPSAPMKKLPPQELSLKKIDAESQRGNQLQPMEPAVPMKIIENELQQPQPNPPRRGHLVNSNTFRIAYELEDVGPSGVSKIELFITENEGKSWFHYGSDNDRTSPIVAKVPRDGDYGFSFRIRNGVGLIATPPQPGDKPEIFVTVDQTQPEAKLQPIQRGQAPRQNDVVIQWTATDRELDANPIALYYATQETGPWELIKGWTANTGRLAWSVPSEIEKNFYIRLDVRDAAGNITRIDGETPYTVDLSRPKARITDVESMKIDGIRQ